MSEHSQRELASTVQTLLAGNFKSGETLLQLHSVALTVLGKTVHFYVCCECL